MAEHNDLGKYGEKMALAHLIEKGYAILESNWRSKNLEIDIVAAKDDEVVFVEVKTRNNDFTKPTDAINRKKMLNIIKAANCYIQQKDISLSPRFDVITVVKNGRDYLVEHIENAFYPPIMKC